MYWRGFVHIWHCSRNWCSFFKSLHHFTCISLHSSKSKWRRNVIYGIPICMFSIFNIVTKHLCGRFWSLMSKPEATVVWKNFLRKQNHKGKAFSSGWQQITEYSVSKAFFFLICIIKSGSPECAKIMFNMFKIFLITAAVPHYQIIFCCCFC